MSNNEYKNLVFTKHALERLDKRSISKDAIYSAITSPENSYPQRKGTTKFIRTVNQRKIHVIATQAENKKWLVVSVWVRGEEDPQPFIWHLITFPFKLLWWLIKLLAHLIHK